MMMMMEVSLDVKHKPKAFPKHSISVSEHSSSPRLGTMMILVTGIVLVTISPTTWACCSKAVESDPKTGEVPEDGEDPKGGDGPQGGNDPEAWIASQKALKFCKSTPGWMTCEFSPK